MHPIAPEDPRAGESAKHIRHSRDTVPYSNLSPDPVQNQNVTGTVLDSVGTHKRTTRANTDRQSKSLSNKNQHATGRTR